MQPIPNIVHKTPMMLYNRIINTNSSVLRLLNSLLYVKQSTY